MGLPVQTVRSSPIVWRAVRRPSAVRTKRNPGDTGFKGSAKEVSRYCDKVSYLRIHRGKKRTQGTETSKYLQERTSTETPQVVASERGPGQWQ